MAEHGLTAPLALLVRRAARADKLITVLLLFILLTTTIAGVSAVLTGPDWVSLWESLLLGLLLGWLLALMGWPAWRSALFLLALGLLFSLLFAGGLGGKIQALPGELIRLAGQTIRSINVKDIDFTGLGAAAGQAYSATGVVVERVFTWLKDLSAGQPVFDPVAAGIVWSAIVWLVAAWSGWVAEAGRNALLAVLPALLLNLSTLSYGHYYTGSLYLMLGISLVLIAVVQFDRRQQGWRQNGVAFPAHKNREVGYISLGIAIGLVILSALISSLSLRQIIDWASEIRKASSRPESGLAKSLGIMPAPTPGPDAFSSLRSPGLPRELLIGSGPELSREQVMSVQVSDLTSLVHDGRLPPLYWRSYTYDVYTGHGWSTSATQQDQYQADQPIQPDHLLDHQLIEQVIRPVPGAVGTVYAAGEPVELNIAVTAAWRSSNDLFGILAGETGYTVQSLLPVTAESRLREAGQEYPNWMLQRYLALPDELPSRIRELAIRLTAAEPTPYERARAIEQYLRQTYPYNLDVPHPPADQDLVDYFLFQLKQGYCDYYASAMVVLARAAGIPARLAIGYASGTYNLNSHRFIVTQAEAHSWVEVYFPGIGWVPFEPTASISAINRSQQPLADVTPTPGTPAPLPAGRVSSVRPEKVVGYFLLGIFIMGSFTWAAFDELNLRRLSSPALAREVYRRLKRYGMRLAVPLEGGETPYELEAALRQRTTQVAGQGWAEQVGSSAAWETRLLVQNIVSLSYSPNTAETGSAGTVLQQWRTLRWRLRLMWMMNSWQSILYGIRNRSREVSVSPSA